MLPRMTALALVLALAAPTFAQAAPRAESRPRADVQNELNTIRSELQDLRQAVERLARSLAPRPGATAAAGGDDRSAARAVAERARTQAQAAAEQARAQAQAGAETARTQARAVAEKARAEAQAARAQAQAARVAIGRTEPGQTVITRPEVKVDAQPRRVMTLPGAGVGAAHSKLCTCDCPCCVALRGIAPHAVAIGPSQPGTLLRTLAAPMAPMQVGVGRAALPAQVDRRCSPPRRAVVVPAAPTPPEAPAAPAPPKPAKKLKVKDANDIDVEIVEPPQPRLINV